MQQSSVQMKSCRGSRLCSQKQYSSVNGISKSLAISQSQGKVLQRYFYRRQSINEPRVELLKLKKLKSQKISSLHHSHHKSTKNTITRGNDDSKDNDLIAELPVIALQKNPSAVQTNQSSMPISITPKFENAMRRTSDWTILYNKNSHAFSKKKNHPQISQFRLKIQSKINKQKSDNSNIDLVLRKHKAGNVKQIQQKLRSVASRGPANETQKQLSIKQFNRKCGYAQNSKIFIWNSEDEHIRRTLLRWGWIMNQCYESPFFHLKWTYMPLFVQCKINEKQFINHFRNTHQITSKSYLTKNLRSNQSSFGKIDSYYPKCYDVGNSSQWNTFVEQFRHNIMLIMLKKIYRLLVDRCPSTVKKFELQSIWEQILDKWTLKTSQIIKTKKIEKGFRQIQFQDHKNPIGDFLIQVNLVVETIKYWRNFRKQRQENEDNSYHYLQFDKNNFLDNFTLIKKYSQLLDISVPNCQTNFTKQMFSTPSELLIQRIIKQYQFCKSMGSLFLTYGQNNIWIVKPTSTSRGSGIYLTTDLYQIQSSTKGIQSRLVQKYIQQPFLVKNPQFAQLHMRKFDLRQWVLLKSIDPLQIYMFSECYLRLCYEKYNPKQILQLNKHLTNYSINKQKFKNKQQSVLPLSYLKQVLIKQHRITWEQTLKPKIEQIIIKSIKSCMDSLDDCGGNCFQLLGFDILIDQQLNPWLLQINMSPACEERTPWLSDYLNDMTVGMLQILLPKQLVPASIEEQTQYKWQLIARQESFFNRKKDVQVNMQIIGSSIQLHQERHVDMYILKNKMAIKIQNFFKQYVPRYRIYKNNKKQKQKIISKYLLSIVSLSKLASYKNKYYTNSINVYLSSLCSFSQLRRHQKIQNARIIFKYLQTAICVNKYNCDFDRYKLNIFASVALTVHKKRQLEQFTKQIIQKNKKITKIQQKCRQYLNYRTQKRRNLQKYLKCIIQLKKQQKRQQKFAHNKNMKTIQKYFSAIYLNRIAEQKMVKNKQRTVCVYLANLLGRADFYARKLEIFIYMVGRVEKVAKRRTRCGHFRGILDGWKRQVQLQRQFQIQQQNNRIRNLIAQSREKLKKQEKNIKIGSIRPNKKADFPKLP